MTSAPLLEPDTDDLPAAARRRRPWTRRRIATWAVALIVAGVALFYAAVLFYAKVLNDAPDELSTSDLSEAVAAPPEEAPSDAASETGTDPATDAASAPAAEPAAVDAASADFDGTWVATSASEFGYRVDEVLGGVDVTAVGRSNEIDATLTVSGTTATIDASVDVATIESDRTNRDSQFRGRIMNAAEFPTATFTTTTPIELGTIPAPGEQVTATVTGELTLKGVTRPVTFEVTAETGTDRIGVLGSIPVVFADYGIENPSFGTISVEDAGLVEFVLVFDRG